MERLTANTQKQIQLSKEITQIQMKTHKLFKSNVLELLKGSIINGYNEKQTAELLQNYGIKLSNYERQINLGDLDAQYMLLVETPQDKVNFLLDNMDQIILTIPTTSAPAWMVNEINSTYKKIGKKIF